jgi:hypothetical protein
MFNLPVGPDEVPIQAEIVAFLSIDEQSIGQVEMATALDALAKYVKADLLTYFEPFFPESP